MLKKSIRKAKAGRVVRRTLADGTVKEYHYGAYKAVVSRVPADGIEALIRAYKRSPNWSALSPRTQANYTVYFRPLLEIGHLAVKSVSRRDILDLRDALAVTRGPAAANAFVAISSVLFGWAVDREWIPHNPTHKIDRLPSGSLPAWTVEQAEAAIRTLPEHMRRAVILGLYTGQRRGDLCAVQWSAYDGATLRFTQGKTGAEVALHVHPDLKAELDAWRGTATGHILLNSRGKPWTPGVLSDMMKKWFAKTGLPPGLNVHGMRKLFAAGMADHGATTHEIASNTGHRTLGMVQHYTRSADQKKLSEASVGKIQTFTIERQPIEKKGG